MSRQLSSWDNQLWSKYSFVRLLSNLLQINKQRLRLAPNAFKFTVLLKFSLNFPRGDPPKYLELWSW